MISVIITSKNEPLTIGRAIKAFLNQDYRDYDFEILVNAPDEDTLAKARQLKSAKVKTIQDTGQGKPAALNFSLAQAKGDILIFSDGEVEIKKGAIKSLLDNLLSAAVTGRPVSINDQTNKYGFWSHCLVDMAHQLRIKCSQQKKFILLSGYLFAVKKDIIKNFKFPANILTEDEYLSYYIYNEGHQINYAPEAIVKVKYADNYYDWIAQKIRSLGGSYQIPAKWKQDRAMRSFSRESRRALSLFRRYGHSFQQRIWLLHLIIARLHAWFKSFVLIKIFRQDCRRLWIRVESTK